MFTAIAIAIFFASHNPTPATRAQLSAWVQTQRTELADLRTRIDELTRRGEALRAQAAAAEAGCSADPDSLDITAVCTLPPTEPEAAPQAQPPRFAPVMGPPNPYEPSIGTPAAAADGNGWCTQQCACK